MEFRLLGPVEVLEDGRPLPLGGRRQRAVLTHLLLSRGTPVSPDLLIDQVWADEAPAAVRASLHTYVSRLRGTLGHPRLETRSAGYLLHAAPGEVDAERFADALARARAQATEDPRAAVDCFAEALALWRGPALGDLADEPSLRGAADRLDALHERAVEESVAARLACGDHHALVPELADLVSRSGLREDLWAHYVLALYRCGRQADALAACDRARRLLADELGVEPGPALRRLQEQVLRQDPALLPGGAALHGYRLREVLGRGPSAVVHRAVQPAVGREVALKVLHRAVSDDPELVHRFAAATQAAAAVEHPHVVPLYDCWRGPGEAVLVLRLLRGGSLADRARRGELSLGALARLLEQVASALDACSRHGVVHHELSAQDVLLDDEDSAYVSSFVLTRDLARGRVEPAVVARSTSAASSPAGGPSRPEVRALAALLQELLGMVPGAHAQLHELADRAARGDAFPDAVSFATAVRDAVPPPVPAQRAPWPRPEPPRNPYKGLHAFTEADAPDFAGRTQLVERLVTRLARPPSGDGLRLLAVVGPSGSGKSSVVRAGLVPALRAGRVADVDRWYVVDVVPGDAPFAELATALSRVAVDPLPADAAASFRSDATSLLRTAESLLPPDGDGGGRSALLLLVDQFEELFTLVGEADRRAFVAALVTAATTPGGRVRVVVTLRADFYDRPLRYPELAELLRAGTEIVVPLTPADLEQAVVDPAERVGLRVEPALIAQVVADVGDAPGALPLLQFALTELAERSRGGVLSLSTYRQVGGVAGALVRRADGVHRRFTPAQQHVARQVLLQLVQPTESGVDTRRRVLQEHLVRRTDDPATAHQVVAALGAARLLAFDRDPATRAPTVEVAHEALLREWSLLRGWADAARDDLRTERRLAAAAREWHDTGRDASFLATGSRLQALEQWSSRWAASDGWSPTALERSYLDASLRAREEEAERERDRVARGRRLEQRSVRRLQALALVLAAGVVAAGALMVFGVEQRNRAERESVVAAARGLAAAAVASLEVDPERGVLLALEAVRLTREQDGFVLPEAEEALHRTLVASRVVLTLRGIGGAAAWSEGGLVVTEGPEGSGLVDLREAATGRPVRAWKGHEVDVNQVAFSPDGTRLLTTGDDGAARLWDVATGRLVWEVRGGGQVWGPAFSRDGRRASAAWQGEGVVRVLDAASGSVVGDVRSVGRPRTTALSADGGRVVVGGEPVPGALVHDVGTGRQLLHLATGSPPAYGVDVDRSGRWVATSGVDQQARLWGLDDGSARGTLISSAPIADLDWSPDSSRVVVAGVDGAARVFEVGDRGPLEVLRLSSTGLKGISGAAFSPDGGRVLLGGAATAAAQIWDVSVGGSREWATVAVPTSGPVGADFTADGREVLVSHPDGRVAVLDASDGSRRTRTDRAGGTVGRLRTSPDGRLVAGAADSAVRVWEVATGAEVFAVPSAGRASAVTWSPDGALLAIAAGDGRLRLVDRRGAAVPLPPSLSRQTQPPERAVTAVDFTTGGRRLVTASRPAGREAEGGRAEAHVQVQDRGSGEVVERWPVDTRVVATDPHGRLVATGQDDGDVVLRELGSGAPAQLLVGHSGPVWDLDWSPDGRRLATSGQDGTVRLWDVGGREEVLVLHGHQSVVLTVRFSPDGRRLVSSSGDGTVRVWAVDLDDLVEIATSRVTRPLTERECRRYLQRSDCS